MLPLKAEIGTMPGRPVQCLRIDDYISRNGVEAVGLVRISGDRDAIVVLHGMGQTLAAQRPDLLVDLHERAAADGLDQTLCRYGYRCYAVDNAQRELRPLETNTACHTEGPFQVLASARPPADIKRIAANALGRLINH
jgi:hypothetical protein